MSMHRVKRVMVCLVAVCAVLGAGRAAGASKLYVGAASVSITPGRPVALSGQMHTRIARVTEAEAIASVLALESREGTQTAQAVFVACDLVAIDDEVLAGTRKRLAGKVAGLDPRMVVLSATHTHTAPVTKEGDYHIAEADVMRPAEYVEFLCARLAGAVARAWESRKPGRAGWGLGHAMVAQNRRAIYADGHAQMYGATDRAEFRGIEGPEDHGVEVLCFWDETGNLIATAINLACPSQEVEGGSTVHADFWHTIRQALQSKHGKGLVVLGWTGAAGDQSPHLMYRKKAEERMRALRGLTRLEELAGRVVTAWEEAYAGARKEPHGDAVLRHQIATVELPLRVITEPEAAEARSKVAALSKDPRNRRLVVWHQDVVDRFDSQKAGTSKPYKMELHAIRLGDVAIATNAFEYYTQFGIQIKSRSRALQTFLIQLAGPGTYVPTQIAVRGGGYSAIPESNVVGPEGGQVLAERTVELVNSLWPE